MKARKRNVRNAAPVAPREQTSSEAYGGDIYDKGALTLHALRYLIGDEAFLRSIRRMAYPTPESETWTDGRAERLVTTDDYVNIASTQAKQDLRWFFEVYIRQAKLPRPQERSRKRHANSRMGNPRQPSLPPCRSTSLSTARSCGSR